MYPSFAVGLCLQLLGLPSESHHPRGLNNRKCVSYSQNQKFEIKVSAEWTFCGLPPFLADSRLLPPSSQGLLSLCLCSAAVVQSLSCVCLFATLGTAARQASPYFINCRSLLKFTPIESVMPSNHLILCHPLLLLPSIFASIRVFPVSWLIAIRWPKYWSFRFSIGLCSNLILKGQQSYWIRAQPQ